MAGVVSRHISTIMYLGNLAEYGDTKDICKNPLHPWEDTPFTWLERVHYIMMALGAVLLIGKVLLCGVEGVLSDCLRCMIRRSAGIGLARKTV